MFIPVKKKKKKIDTKIPRRFSLISFFDILFGIFIRLQGQLDEFCGII